MSARATAITFLPNGLTVHRFGEDASGELCAPVTDAASSGTGGIVYAIVPTVAQIGVAAIALLGLRRSPEPSGSLD